MREVHTVLLVLSVRLLYVLDDPPLHASCVQRRVDARDPVVDVPVRKLTTGSSDCDRCYYRRKIHK